MNESRWVAAVCVCGLFSISCGAVPSASNLDGETVAEASAALDASCSITTSNVSGYVDPVSGGYLSVYASASCADQAWLEYRFSAKDPKNRALAAQDWSYPSTFWALPAGSKEGTYTVTIEARRAGTTDVVAKTTLKTALGRVCEIAGPALDPSSAQPGDSISIQPFLWCPPEITGQWNATITKPGGGTVSLPWTTNSQAIWDTTGLVPGTATVQVSVRNLGNTVADATSKVSYILGNTCSVATLVASGTGLSRRLDASATCTGSATPSYSFSVVAPDGTLSLSRDFSGDAGFDWNTTGLDGTFSARVDVRAEQSPTQPLSTKSIKMPLGDPCTKVTLADTWGTHLRSESLPLIASATCGAAELSFQLRSVGASTWTTVCPYSSETSCVLDLSTQPAGDYVARALVRKSGSIAASDAASAARDFVLLDGAALLRPVPGFAFAPTITGLSPDGRWVVGSGGGLGGFRWSRVNGPIELPGLGVLSAAPTAVTSSGVTIGSLASNMTQLNQPALWNGNNITQILPQEAYVTFANGVSADGKVVVGTGATSAYRWTAKTGMVDLGAGFSSSGAHDVSADGSVVAGYVTVGSHGEAARWTAQTGMVALGLLPGCSWSEARSISQDGKVVVGNCGGSGVSRGYRWTAESGMQDLGALPGAATTIALFSTNADGSVIVGNVVSDNRALAVTWTAASGLRFLSDVLAESGTNLGNWTVDGLVDVSSDGKTMAGYGNLGSFLLTLP